MRFLWRFVTTDKTRLTSHPSRQEFCHTKATGLGHDDEGFQHLHLKMLLATTTWFSRRTPLRTLLYERVSTCVSVRACARACACVCVRHAWHVRVRCWAGGQCKRACVRACGRLGVVCVCVREFVCVCVYDCVVYTFLLILKVKPACWNSSNITLALAISCPSPIYSDARPSHGQLKMLTRTLPGSSRYHDGPQRSWCAADLATAKFCSVTLGSLIPRIAEGNNIHHLNSFGPRAHRAARP